MIKINYQVNPFTKEEVVQTLSGCPSISAWVSSRFPGAKEFPCPTICLLNESPISREEWNTPLVDGDEVTFLSQPGYNLLWQIPAWVYYGLTAVAIYAVAVSAVPSAPGQLSLGEIGEADPVYSLKGQRNQAKLGGFIEDPYGLNRLWPSVASNPYTRFSGNDQDLYLLLCLGQGFYDTTSAEVRIEDTVISNFQDIEYAFYDPGDPVTLFPDNVETNGEVGNIELFAQNEPEYIPDWSEPYTANSSGTLAYTLEVDIAFPTGLYYAANDGSLTAKTVTVDVEYVEIDDAATIIGTYASLGSFSKTLKTSTPQRFTMTKEVTPARYAVRARRNEFTPASLGAGVAHRTQESVHWVGLRSVLPSTKDYGNVTLLAIKARASNNLNDSSKSRINVVCNRKLPTWDGSAWTAPVSTRSVVWAFCNILRAEYNGGLGDDYLDLAGLLAINTTLEASSIYFDHVFDSQASIWNRLEIIAVAAGGFPVPIGSKIGMTLDGVKTIPLGIFSKENIVKDSLSISYKLLTDDEHDGIEVEYEEPNSYIKSTVSCLVGTDAGENMQSIKLVGVKDRTRAWRHGMRIREAQKRRRVSAPFETGREGYIPNFNDLIYISHDMFGDDSQSGRVSAFSVSGANVTVTLDQDLDWTGAGPHAISFLSGTGDEIGPVTVTIQASLSQVLFAESELGDTAANVFDLSDNQEKPIYIFGTQVEKVRKMRVTQISPSDGEKIRIEAIEDDPDIYSHDGETPSAATPGTTPGEEPDLPVVVGLNVRDIPSRATISQATWIAALGAKKYFIQISADGVTWEDLPTTTGTFIDFPVPATTYLYVRVAGINVGRGSWATWEGNLGDISGIATSGVVISTAGTSGTNLIVSDLYLSLNHEVVLVDASSGDIDIYLPAASDNAFRHYKVKIVDITPGNFVTIIPDGADTVDNGSTYVLSTVDEEVDVTSDGATDWFIY